MPGYHFREDSTLLEAGVTSLKAMEMFFKLEMALGMSINLAKIGATSTISDVIENLAGGAKPIPGPEASRHTRIILSGLFGEELTFLAFLDDLPDTTRFSSEPLPGIEADCELQTDIDAVARHLVQQIMERGVQGDLTLAGVSYGAVLAHEIARKLMERGQSVRTLILIDPLLAPSRIAPLKRAAERALRSAGRRTGPMAGAGTPRAVAPGERLATLTFFGLMGVGAYRRARDFIIGAYGRRDPEWIIQRTREYFAIARGRAIRRWSGGVCDVPTTIIAGTDFTAQSSLERWRALCPHLTVEPIEADHFSLFMPEHVPTLRALFLKATHRGAELGRA